MLQLALPLQSGCELWDDGKTIAAVLNQPFFEVALPLMFTGGLTTSPPVSRESKTGYWRSKQVLQCSTEKTTLRNSRRGGKG
jgi:hypothetical protein